MAAGCAWPPGLLPCWPPPSVFLVPVSPLPWQVPSVPNWTKQHPAASPLARWGASMAYDAATGNVVLFGGSRGSGNVLRDTWVWNGATWAKRAPATSPPALFDAAMAYDAATGNVVLF